jgi:hypothetical protein
VMGKYVLQPGFTTALNLIPLCGKKEQLQSGSGIVVSVGPSQLRVVRWVGGRFSLSWRRGPG